MSEVKAVYVTNVPSPLVVLCHCGETVGYCVRHEDNRVWLLIGNLILSSAHGRCASCGEEYHWVASDKTLEDLLARRRRVLQLEVHTG